VAELHAGRHCVHATACSAAPADFIAAPVIATRNAPAAMAGAWNGGWSIALGAPETLFVVASEPPHGWRLVRVAQVSVDRPWRGGLSSAMRSS
jgi:hypothetical protein